MRKSIVYREGFSRYKIFKNKHWKKAFVNSAVSINIKIFYLARNCI